MESILALFQSILLLIIPMKPVSLSAVQIDNAFPTSKEWHEATPSASLSRVVDGELSGTNGKYNIYIKHLATGEVYRKNANDQMLSASMYKAWLAAGTLEEIRKGNLRMDQILSDSIENLNEWAGLAPEDAELTSGMAKYTVKEALGKMIGVSHNYSAFLLTRTVGNPKVQAILKKQGLINSHFVRPPKVDVADMALFYERVYRGRLFEDEKYSQILRDLLASNELNDGLPKLLPSGTRVEHKTGELDRLLHDCGIVYSKGGDYIICVMTESDDPDLAEARIADISLAVYNYFNK